MGALRKRRESPGIDVPVCPRVAAVWLLGTPFLFLCFAGLSTAAEYAEAGARLPRRKVR